MVAELITNQMMTNEISSIHTVFESEIQNEIFLLRKRSEAKGRVKRASCPDGAGNYGFNTYNLMTSALLGFNAVANLIANVNNNDQNNNNNNNVNDRGSAQANTNDATSMNMYMAMVITIVPPIGPPIPVVVGRALQNGSLVLDPRFKKKGVYFQDGDNKMFPNGTIVHEDGTRSEAEVYLGAFDPRKPRELIPITNLTSTDSEWQALFS